MNDEEANAELERLEQNITLLLQDTDQNFSRCNQIASSILPMIDKFSEATHNILKTHQTWGYFFDLLQSSSSSSGHGTNRLPLTRPFGAFATGIDAISETTSITESFRSISERIIEPVKQGHQHLLEPHLIPSRRQIAQSLPDFTQPVPPTAETARTPQRDLARMKTDSILKSSGLYDLSPSSETSGDEESATNNSKTSFRRPSVSYSASDDPANLGVGTDADRERALRFFKEREQRFGNMPMDEELPSLGRKDISPLRAQDRNAKPLADTPTTRRVFETLAQDLKTGRKPRIDIFDESYEPHNINKRSLPSGSTNRPTFEDYTHNLRKDKKPRLSELGRSHEFEYNNLPGNFRPIGTPEDPDPLNFPDMAISRPLNGGGSSGVNSGSGVDGSSNHGYRQGPESVFSETSGLTRATFGSSSTGRGPAPFSVHRFGETFREPPGSTQLTRVYKVFSDKPAQMLTLEDVLNEVKDDENRYTADSVMLFINMLCGKKYLRTVGQGWTIRR
ncbi:hypothetical protein J3Q64DRAFT_1696333 [Phycomyces blakesleeanus]|uniref:DASH complex subunit ASK1 n=2 Tax=Phycomyces blakesleeanus TaxID=4837 RepID=A0A162TW40_PHYB8|nr:hypothetical protein PHYBLDRAFT_171666 [Phycomyces blakesleeanus NRRL 1555(-)]OAD70283.1 hypothetical protein PHYBLDRAFT_171666 [Phycomyces blakesleeanus NRRL 1555(-)]|eukprot:XP_018288323.1 hypothetical protein PHYBLDRAFT_171666 [Phycomyces blakesleeanus NRRL 1555(-)]